ncbi:Dimer_Tnp_hAT domain-containing protein/DUF4413 domain-containing protein, partial [Cephalotus follicularis]
LTEWEKNSDEIISTMANKMLVKFEKYWDAIHGIMAVACVLDPRYKMCLLEYFYEASECPRENNLLDLRPFSITCAGIHKPLPRTDSRIPQIQITPLHVGYCCGRDFRINRYDKYVRLKKREKTYVKSELEHYLEEDVLPREETFDILAWWKSNGIKYPTLQTIARDIYAIPICTVASESTFSMGGRLVSSHRSRLHPTTVKALACTQSWL